MGVVFDAENPAGQRVALKMIQTAGDPESSGTLVARFLREARILGQLNHPSIVDLVEAGDLDGMLYLAMQRIEGVSLLAVRRQGPLSIEPLRQLGAQLADALAHMHAANVVHRDIKPANILIQPDGRPVITDFGISGLSEATGITRQGDLLGSPGFMSPEVVAGGTPSALSDQYALGRLLFELAARGPSKRLPKNAPIFEVLRIAMEVEWPRFPSEPEWSELEGIVRRMLSPHPEDRYETAAAAKAALEGQTGSVLDTETLSEHIGQLDLPSSTSYEALALDLLGGPDPGTDQEAFLADLELPAGARAPSGASNLGAGTVPVLGLPQQQAQLLAVDPQDPDGDGATRIDAVAPDTMPPRPLPSLTLPSSAPAVDEVAPTPLSELLQRRPSADAGPQQALGPQAARIDVLERQASRAREELAKLRRSLNEARRKKPWGWLALGAALALPALGLGYALGLAPRPVPVLVMVPTDARRVTPAEAIYEGAAPPSDRDREDARGLLLQAQTHFEGRNLDQAERLLALCIQLADLPECHRSMGSMLTLTRSPKARAHFQRYLQLAPNAADAPTIRGFLNR